MQGLILASVGASIPLKKSSILVNNTPIFKILSINKDTMSRESPVSIYPDKVDLNNCDREPIHLIGKIQNHGFLLAGHLTTRKISCNLCKVYLYQLLAIFRPSLSHSSMCSVMIIVKRWKQRINNSYVVVGVQRFETCLFPMNS